MMTSLLNVDTVKSLAAQKMEIENIKKIVLIAVEGNWGPPISGRYDTDFLTIWAAIHAEDNGEVYLQGARDGEWSILEPFKLVEKTKKIKLYKIAPSGPSEFPHEFVIRLNIGDESFYDNNNGANYKLRPYQRYFTSAAESEGCIFDFNTILGVTLYSKK
jgi:hypothetical protein